MKNLLSHLIFLQGKYNHRQRGGQVQKLNFYNTLLMGCGVLSFTSKDVEPAPRAGLTWEDQLGENLQEGNCLDISGGSKASKNGDPQSG